VPRPGLTWEQTRRLLLVRQLTGWTYAELASATLATSSMLLTQPPPPSYRAHVLGHAAP